MSRTSTALDAVIVVFIVAAALVGLSFALLFALPHRRLLAADDHGGAGAPVQRP